MENPKPKPLNVTSIQPAVPHEMPWWTPWAVAAGGVALALLLLILGVAGVFGSSGSVKLFTGDPVAVNDGGFWHSVDTAGVSTSNVSGPSGTKAVSTTLSHGRTSFTASQWTFEKPQSFFGRQWAFVTFRGEASGVTYTLFLDFNARHRDSAGYVIVDTSNAWRSVALDLAHPDFGKQPFDLRHVRSARIVTNAKDQTGRFDVGQLSLSPTS